jgi:diacylglycerol kinase (ATP)
MEKKISNINIIISPASGKEETVLPIINTFMKKAGIQWEASITHKADDAIRLAKAAVKEGVDAVAVYRGDGAVMEVASGLIGSKIPLIILPGGSTNVMPRNLAYPKILKKPARL